MTCMTSPIPHTIRSNPPQQQKWTIIIRVLAVGDHDKIGSASQQRFTRAGTKTPPEQGAALDRNGLSVSTETTCRFEPKSPAGNSEICNPIALPLHLGQTQN